MILIIIYVILFFVYIAAPQHMRLVILVINLFVPDPIPLADEIIMIATLTA